MDYKRIMELEKAVENHHPFCKRNCIEAHLYCLEWHCTCDFLKKYDDWRHSPYPREQWEKEE